MSIKFAPHLLHCIVGLFSIGTAFCVARDIDFVDDEYRTIILYGTVMWLEAGYMNFACWSRSIQRECHGGW